MILKYYLIISILTYLVLNLSAKWMKIRYEKINGKIDKSKVKKISFESKIMIYIRSIIICFMPIFHIFLLAFYIYLFLFANDIYLKNNVFPKIDEELKHWFY